MLLAHAADRAVATVGATICGGRPVGTSDVGGVPATISP
jgi:hypothetical protein